MKEKLQKRALCLSYLTNLKAGKVTVALLFLFQNANAPSLAIIRPSHSFQIVTPYRNQTPWIALLTQGLIL
jgi:hypothetical protein